ncbi:MAG: hypothetical protein M3Q49_01875 [Actinomycetota bacterium]|nr:hypothetical protein [Actinomycetota bacterium]
MTQKSCPICSHPEREFLGKLLAHGMAPRAIHKRVGGTTRKGLAHHRDTCLTTATEHERNEAS